MSVAATAAAAAASSKHNNVYEDEKEDVLPLEDYPITDEDDFSVFLELEKYETNQNEYNRLAQTNVSGFTRNQLRAFRRRRKTLKKERSGRAEERVKRFQELYDKGKPVIMADKYKDAVEEGLVRFFRRGYEKYWNNGQPAEYQDILQFLRKLIQKYKLIISGGFVLKNLGLTSEAKTKPSVDVDIFIPSNAPVKHPEFYETMAKIFDADRDAEKDDWVVRRFQTEGGRRKSYNQLRERGVFSVYSYERDVGMGEDVYAKMDLVRPYDGTSPLWLVRSFDLSICANWYDGVHLYTLDSKAIFKKSAGFFNPRYNHILFSERGNRYRDRIVKYILRGYRIKYIDTRTGKIHEFRTSDFPNAIERMNFPQREMYYQEHPNERPVSVANVSATRRNNRNNRNNQKHNNI